MKVLVTGGAGFIGQETVKLFVAEGHRVAVVDNLSSGSPAGLPPDVKLYRRDIRDDLEDIFTREQPDAVFHLAAQTSVPSSIKDPKTDEEVNIRGTVNILENCCRFGVRRFVLGSSSAVYGNPGRLPIKEDDPPAPISPYGISKLGAELYTVFYGKHFGLSTVILRYANVYGPGQLPQGEAGVIPVFIDYALRGRRPCITGTGRQTRDFIYVKDVARANLLALEGPGGITVNIGSGKETSILALWREIAEICGTSLEPQFAQERPGDIFRSLLDSRKAGELLGFYCRISLREGLSRCIRAARERMETAGNE